MVKVEAMAAAAEVMGAAPTAHTVSLYPWAAVALLQALGPERSSSM